MAIAVSQAYKDVHARRSGKRARVVVQYKRRYFDPGAMAFAYEPAWRVLQQRDFVDPGEIVDQLDVAEPGIFKATTVTLRLKNTQNQWVRSPNDPSAFAADALAPNGYYDDQMLVQILYGHYLPNGTWEDCPQFTGYAFDYTPLPKQGYMEVAVSASLLAEKCAATKINTVVTGEAMAASVVNEPLNPSPGDGTTATLKTTATGVISVTNVKADGTTLTLTTDYTVSIPSNGTAAKIILVNPAAQNGKALTWTGVTKNLLTTSSGVVSVKNVYADGVKLTQGGDYTVSLASGAQPAQINLVDPGLWIGSTFTWDGAKGQQNMAVEAAVALYCDAAGIGSGARSIQPVIFQGGLASSKTIDTQADWLAGTSLVDIDAASTPGDISIAWFLVDNFADGNYTANPTWTARWQTGNASFNISSSRLYVAGSHAPSTPAGAGIETPIYGNVGAIRMALEMIPGGYSGNGINPELAVLFFQANTGSSATGYGLYTEGGGSAVYFSKWTGAATYGLTSGGPTKLVGCGAVPSGSHVWAISRDAAGVFVIYKDGVQVGTYTDTTYTTFQAMAVAGSANVGGAGNPETGFDIFVTDIYFTPSTILPTAALSAGPAVYESQVFNILSTPTAWGTLDRFQTLNGGTVTYYTASSADGVTFDAWVAISGAGAILSAPKQYFKIKAVLAPAAGIYTTPVVHKLIARFSTSTINLSLVAPTSGTAWEKIQVYARMCNYETGWDSTGVFFFRSRTVAGDPVIELDPWTNVVDLDDPHPGWDRVFNIGHASQPPYEYYYGKDDAAEPEPTSERRFGPIQRDLDFGGELVANDAQIGLAAARQAYLDGFRPRWRCRVPSKLIAWLELSDPVLLTMVPDRKLLDSVAGDPLQQSGFAGPQGVALANKKKMKIVGRTKRLRAGMADLLLEEILS